MRRSWVMGDRRGCERGDCAQVLRQYKRSVAAASNSGVMEHGARSEGRDEGRAVHHLLFDPLQFLCGLRVEVDASGKTQNSRDPNAEGAERSERSAEGSHLAGGEALG